LSAESNGNSSKSSGGGPPSPQGPTAAPEGNKLPSGPAPGSGAPPGRPSLAQMLQYDGQEISEKVPMLLLKECNQTVQDLRSELATDERVRTQELLPANAATIARQVTPCLMIASVSENNDIMKYINLLKLIKDDVKQNRIKFLVFSKIKNPAIIKTFESFGCHEYILEPIAKKSLMFKMGLHIKALHGQRKKIRADANRKDEVKLKAKKPGEVETANAENKDTGIKKAAAQENENDAWVFRGNKPKKAGGKWTMRMKGPDPSKGKWLNVGKNSEGGSQWRFMDPETAAKVEEAQKKGLPLDRALEAAGSKKNGWEWEGDQPQHHNGDWNFASEKPNLTCYNQDGTKSHSKVETSPSGELIASEDSQKALAKVAQMEAQAEADKQKRKKSLFGSAESGEPEINEKSGEHGDAKSKNDTDPSSETSGAQEVALPNKKNSQLGDGGPKKNEADFRDSASDSKKGDLRTSNKSESDQGAELGATESKKESAGINQKLFDAKKQEKDSPKTGSSAASKTGAIKEKNSEANDIERKSSGEAGTTSKETQTNAKEKTRSPFLPKAKTDASESVNNDKSSKADQNTKNKNRENPFLPGAKKPAGVEGPNAEARKKNQQLELAEAKRSEREALDSEDEKKGDAGESLTGENAKKKSAFANAGNRDSKKRRDEESRKDTSSEKNQNGGSSSFTDSSEKKDKPGENSEQKKDETEGGWSHHKETGEKKKKWSGRDSDQGKLEPDASDKLVESELSGQDIKVKRASEEIFEYPHDHFGVLNGTWERVEDVGGDWFIYVDPAIRSKKDYNLHVVKNWWLYRGPARPAYLAPIKIWQFRKVRPEKLDAFEKLEAPIRSFLEGLLPGAKKEKIKRADEGLEKKQFRFVAPMGVAISISEFSQDATITPEKVVEFFCQMVGQSLKGASVAVFRNDGGKPRFLSDASDFQRIVAEKCSGERRVFLEKQGTHACLAVVVFDSQKKNILGGVLAETHVDQAEELNEQSNYLAHASFGIRGCLIDEALVAFKKAA